MTLSFTNNKGYIFIVRRLEKQSKLILSRSDSISNLNLNLRIHGPCGPDAHAGVDLQVFLIFCFKPILLSAHKLILLIYGDNSFTNPRVCPTKAICWSSWDKSSHICALLLHWASSNFVTLARCFSYLLDQDHMHSTSWTSTLEVSYAIPSIHEIKLHV